MLFLIRLDDSDSDPLIYFINKPDQTKIIKFSLMRNAYHRKTQIGEGRNQFPESTFRFDKDSPKKAASETLRSETQFEFSALLVFVKTG